MATSVLWLFPRYSELEPWLKGTGLRNPGAKGKSKSHGILCL